jgi:hypothetical protein
MLVSTYLTGIWNCLATCCDIGSQCVEEGVHACSYSKQANVTNHLLDPSLEEK